MIGEILRQILEEKNINANELSKRIGVSSQTLYSILHRNNMKVNIDTMLKICKELDVDIERFYGDYVKDRNVADEKVTKCTNIVKKLTDSGKEKVIDYALMILSLEQNENK